MRIRKMISIGNKLFPCTDLFIRVAFSLWKLGKVLNKRASKKKLLLINYMRKKRWNIRAQSRCLANRGFLFSLFIAYVQEKTLVHPHSILSDGYFVVDFIWSLCLQLYGYLTCCLTMLALSTRTQDPPNHHLEPPKTAFHLWKTEVDFVGF